MRMPQFSKYPGLMRATGGFLLGVIAGVFVYHSIFVTNFEAVKNTNTKLVDQLSQYERDNKLLNLYKDQHTVIKSIRPLIEETPGQRRLSDLTATALKNKVGEQLEVLIGHNIGEMETDAKMTRELLTGRVIHDIYKKDYYIEIKTIIVVDNVLQVWFKPTIVDRTPR
jgi:hypothetical protein